MKRWKHLLAGCLLASAGLVWLGQLGNMASEPPPLSFLKGIRADMVPAPSGPDIQHFELNPDARERYFAMAEQELRKPEWHTDGVASRPHGEQIISYHRLADIGETQPANLVLWYRTGGSKPSMTVDFHPATRGQTVPGSLWYAIKRKLGIP